MLIFKIIGIAFVGVVAFGFIKNIKSDYGIFLLLAVGTVILILVSDYLVNALTAFGDMSTKTGINNDLFSSIIKIIGIGYISEYSSSVCEDTGCSSIAKKIQLGAKVTIFVMSIPIITNILALVEGLL
jgi:stage III sporulation protein AD